MARDLGARRADERLGGDGEQADAHGAGAREEPPLEGLVDAGGKRRRGERHTCEGRHPPDGGRRPEPCEQRRHAEYRRGPDAEQHVEGEDTPAHRIVDPGELVQSGEQAEGDDRDERRAPCRRRDARGDDHRQGDDARHCEQAVDPDEAGTHVEETDTADDPQPGPIEKAGDAHVEAERGDHPERARRCASDQRLGGRQIDAWHAGGEASRRELPGHVQDRVPREQHRRGGDQDGDGQAEGHGARAGRVGTHLAVAHEGEPDLVRPDAGDGEHHEGILHERERRRAPAERQGEEPEEEERDQRLRGLAPHAPHREAGCVQADADVAEKRDRQLSEAGVREERGAHRSTFSARCR